MSGRSCAKLLDAVYGFLRPCGGPSKSPRTSSIVQVIFSFGSFEISEGILGNQKLIIGQDSFSNQ